MQYTFNVSIKVAIFLDLFINFYINFMTTNKKNQISIIKDEEINKALEGFKAAYKENKKSYEKGNVKPEDVESLVKAFSNKSAVLATTVVISVMIAMPPREFMALMETAKSVSKAKFLEAMKEILEEKVKRGADNNIDN